MPENTQRQNAPKPNSPPDVNEPSNVRPPSKPTPNQPPDRHEAAEQGTEDVENRGE